MSSNELAQRERLLDLLAVEATEGLAGPDATDLEKLLKLDEGQHAHFFEPAAAAIHLSAAPEAFEAPPTQVEDQIRAAALSFFETEQPAAPVQTTPTTVHEMTPRRGGTSPAWWLVAASLALAAVGWWQALTPETNAGTTQVTQATGGETDPVTVPDPIPTPDTASDALRIAWAATEDPAAAGAGGEVVWSGDLQRGVMRFEGLEANDPAVSQYQLWIFDKNQDERYPIDGGVFDVPADGSAVEVPIDAKLDVREPTLFAITVEKPGGVVVSSRERIVLVAPVA